MFDCGVLDVVVVVRCLDTFDSGRSRWNKRTIGIALVGCELSQGLIS